MTISIVTTTIWIVATTITVVTSTTVTSKIVTSTILVCWGYINKPFCWGNQVIFSVLRPKSRSKLRMTERLSLYSWWLQQFLPASQDCQPAREYCICEAQGSVAMSENEPNTYDKLFMWPAFEDGPSSGAAGLWGCRTWEWGFNSVFSQNHLVFHFWFTTMLLFMVLTKYGGYFQRD